MGSNRHDDERNKGCIKESVIVIIYKTSLTPIDCLDHKKNPFIYRYQFSGNSKPKKIM
jgi:hypothetical protein